MKHLIIFLIAASAALGNPALWPAEFPAANSGWWEPHTTVDAYGGGTPGVGVPGGFMRFTAGQAEDRAVTGNVINVVAAHGADNTGVSDASAAINAAFTASAEGDVIYLPAGTYRIVGGISANHTKANRRTLRGAGSGLDGTIIEADPTTNLWTAIYIGSGGSWRNGDGLAAETAAKQLITSTKTKGISTVSVANASAFVVGGFAVVASGNEHDDARIEAGAVPDWSSTAGQSTSVNNEQFNVGVRITARDTGANTVTFDPPLLRDCTLYDTYLVPADSPGTETFYFGMESLRLVDDASDAQHYWMGVDFGRAIYSWVYDVHATYRHTSNSSGSPIFFNSHGYRNEVRRSVLVANPDTASLTVPSWTDGAIQMRNQTSMLIEDNQFLSARATDSYGWDVSIYHNEGCYNWVIANNFFEQDSKNIQVNHGGGRGMMGLMEGNIGQLIQSDGYFATASNYTEFRNWWSGYNADGISPRGSMSSYNRFTRQFVVAGNVWGYDGKAGTLLPSYGLPNIGNPSFTGTVRPTLGTFWADWAAMVAGTYTNTTNGFQEKDLDVEPSFSFFANYESSTTTGTLTGTTGVTMPASLFRATKPDWFGTLDMTVVDSTAPAWSYAANPAGYRFINSTEVPGYGAPAAGNATVTTLNASTLNIH